MKNARQLDKLNRRIIRCKKCPRLITYIQKISKEKVRRFQDQKYWGKPLSGFGDYKAELLIVGLAPAAHGGNRTGRMFTGDSSGDWVARVLYENGFATNLTSEFRNDGFTLVNAYITAIVKCAPPQNKPSPEEIHNCSTYLRDELSILKNVKVIVCLGKIAFDSCCRLLQIKGCNFVHGKIYNHDKWIIISSYHPSRQNTQTGRLTWSQWYNVFSKAKQILAGSENNRKI